MMSTSFSQEAGAAITDPVTSFQYRDMRSPGESHSDEAEIDAEEDGPPGAARGPSVQQVSDLMDRTRAEAIAETEARLKHAYDARAEAQALKIREALERFDTERKTYFSRVEAEVVQLALAIAAKILHRQAQVDPMLVAALVRLAVEKLHDGSTVSVRVSPTEAGKWRTYLANPLNGSTIEIVEDAHLGSADCVLETDLGSANFSIDAQLKEVEQGFFDLLAQRPVVK